MAPILPISADNPDGGSDELLQTGDGESPPIVIFLNDENSEGDYPIIDLTNDDDDDDDISEIPTHSHEGYELLSQDQEAVANSMDNNVELAIEFVSQVPYFSASGDTDEIPNVSSSTTDNIGEIPNVSKTSSDSLSEPVTSDSVSEPVTSNSVSEPVTSHSISEPVTSDSVSEPAAEAIPEMDEEHIEKIKNVMKSIKLPPCNVPAWTTVVPEEEWKTVLLEKLNVTVKESCDTGTSSNSSTKDETKSISKG